MYSLRRWLYRPKRSDSSLLAQFYFADEELNLVAAELDSFEGRKDPERCTALVNQLRACQARVLNVVSQMMDETVKEHRAQRDFRVKFPDDVIQENLAGQLWFGAECLAAGSSIMNREVESACMRPLARALVKNLESLRTTLRDQCLQNVHEYNDMIKESLIIFDKLFAEFELSYVSAMVPVKTAHEYDMIQEITVLFSETVQRSLKVGLLTVDMIDEYDPALMFTIPRLAVVCGVHIFKDGPLNPDNDPWNISEMFRPFQTLLLKIRELLGILTESELMTLERALCSQEEPSFLISLDEKKKAAKEEKRKSKEENKKRKDSKKLESEGDDGSVESELTALEIAERLEALALNFEASRNGTANASDQAELDSQSKSSEGSSGSTSSALSEGSREAESTDAQLQQFTDQLYYEANLDSQFIPEETLERPLNVLSQDPEPPSNIPLPQHLPIESSLSTEHSSSGGTVSASPPHESHKCPNGQKLAEDNNNHNTVASLMVKCNSNDSGLHSEVVSNSSSMFTVSSSDSNHLISPDTPTSPQSFSQLQEFSSAEWSTDQGKNQETLDKKNGPDMSDASINHENHIAISEEDLQNSHSHLGAIATAQHESIVSMNGVADASESDIFTAGSSKLDTGQGENNISESIAVSNSPSCKNSPNKPSVSCEPQSTHTHSSFCDTSVFKAGDLSARDDSEGSVQMLQAEAPQSDRSSCSKDLNAQPECEETNSQQQPLAAKVNNNVTNSPPCSCSTPESNANSPSPPSSNLHAHNRASTETASSSHLPHLSKPSTSQTAVKIEGSSPQSVVSPVPNSSQAASAPSEPVKSPEVSKKDGTSSKDYKGKLKRASGIRKKRSTRPSRTKSQVDDQLLDGEGCNSSETSSYTSDCGDQEEIALAMEAVESATQQQVRARFRSSSDMIHRLFVCISGVADQLQTNFAGDLRNILRSVFDMNCSEPVDITDEDKCKDTTPLGAAYIAISNAARNARRNRTASNQSQAPPMWVPDEETTECMSCQVPFSFVRRRHHCRNCGKIFCHRCSSNFVPLPHFGQEKCVRVCNRCFIFRVTPFTVRSPTQ